MGNDQQAEGTATYGPRRANAAAAVAGRGTGRRAEAAAANRAPAEATAQRRRWHGRRPARSSQDGGGGCTLGSAPFGLGAHCRPIGVRTWRRWCPVFFYKTTAGPDRVSRRRRFRAVSRCVPSGAQSDMLPCQQVAVETHSWLPCGAAPNRLLSLRHCNVGRPKQKKKERHASCRETSSTLSAPCLATPFLERRPTKWVRTRVRLRRCASRDRPPRSAFNR